MQPTPQPWDFALPDTLKSSPSCEPTGLLRNQCYLALSSSLANFEAIASQPASPVREQVLPPKTC